MTNPPSKHPMKYHNGTLLYNDVQKADVMEVQFHTSSSISTMENLVREKLQSENVLADINYLFLSSGQVWNTIQKLPNC